MLLRLVYTTWQEAIRAIVTQLQAFDQANTAAIDLKADIASPTLTGTPAAPTAVAGTNTTQLATTAFVTTADNLKANLAGSTAQSFSMLNGTVAGIVYLGNGNPNIQGIASDIHVSSAAVFNAVWTYTATGFAVANYYQSAGEHVWRTAVAGTAGGVVTYAERMRITNAGAVIFGTPIRLKGYTVATLPAGVQGDKAFVTDALAPTYLVTVAGGGAVVTEVFYNGTNWVCT